MHFNGITNSQVLKHTHICFNSPEDALNVESCLEKIASKKNGNLLISKINRHINVDTELYIHVVHDEPTETKPFLNEQLRRAYRIKNEVGSKSYKMLLDMRSRPPIEGGRGEGVSSQIHFNPNESRLVDEDGIGTRVEMPEHAFLSLAHELVHAYHYLHGTHLKDDTEDPYANKEEERATGIMDFKDMLMTENGIRRDHNIRERTTIYDQNEVSVLAKKYLPSV